MRFLCKIQQSSVANLSLGKIQGDKPLTRQDSARSKSLTGKPEQPKSKSSQFRAQLNTNNKIHTKRTHTHSRKRKHILCCNSNCPCAITSHASPLSYNAKQFWHLPYIKHSQPHLQLFHFQHQHTTLLYQIFMPHFQRNCASTPSSCPRSMARTTTYHSSRIIAYY